MSKEYGYLGAIDCKSAPGSLGVGVASRVPTLSAQGEAIYLPANEGGWADELKSDDGAWRFLKFGGAAAPNTTMLTLDRNFTILALNRQQQGATSYNSVASKYTGATGWSARASAGNNGFSMYSYSYAYNYVPTDTLVPQMKNASRDKQWHWMAWRFSDKIYFTLDGGAQQASIALPVDGNGQVLTLDNPAAPFNLPSQPAQSLAAVLVFNRVLTDQEVSDVMAGDVKPKAVAGLVGYYKFNETHGNVSGQCTDYSGKGNHLVYNGQAQWEKWAPDLIANGGFDTDTAWTKGDGWTISGGRAVAVASAASKGLEQPIAFIGGGRYALSFDYSLSGGNCIAYCGQGAQTIGISFTGTGSFYSEFVRGPTGTQKLLFQAPLGLYGTIDNVKLTDLSGQSGHPYVKRQKLSSLNWWDRKPRQAFDPAMQGSFLANNLGTNATKTTTAAEAVTTELTLAGWVKPHRTDSQNNANMLAVANNDWRFGIQGHGNMVVLFKNNVGIALNLSRPIPSNKWTFLAITHVASSGTVYFYLNGLLVGVITGQSTAAFLATVGQGISIGSNSATRVQSVRSLRLFRRVLTPAEIENLFQLDVVADRSGMVLEYMCNDLSLSYLKDSGPSKFDSQTFSGADGRQVINDSPYIAYRKRRKGKQLYVNSNGASFANKTATQIALQASPVWTVSCWGKSYGTNNAAQCRLAWVSGNTTRNGVELTLVGSFLAISISSSASVLYPASSRIDSAIGDWCLLSVEINWVTKTLRRFINGVLVRSEVLAALSGSIPSFSGDTQINLFRPGGTTSSTVDDVRVWGRVLSDTEHRSLYFDAAPMDGLIVEYKFDNDGPVVGPELAGMFPMSPPNFTSWWGFMNGATAGGVSVLNLPTASPSSEALCVIAGMNTANKSYQVQMMASGNGTVSFGITNSIDLAVRTQVTLTATPTLFTTVVTMNSTVVSGAGVSIYRASGDTCTQATVTFISAKEISLPQIRDTSGNNNHAMWGALTASSYVQVP